MPELVEHPVGVKRPPTSSTGMPISSSEAIDADGLRDRAALAVAAQVGDLPVLDADVDSHLVAAERVVVVELEIVRLSLPKFLRVLVVLEDVVAVEGVIHQSWKTLRASFSASTSLSTSSRLL